jgi:hypothetical protein
MYYVDWVWVCGLECAVCIFQCHMYYFRVSRYVSWGVTRPVKIAAYVYGPRAFRWRVKLTLLTLFMLYVSRLIVRFGYGDGEAMLNDKRRPRNLQT